MFMKQVRFIISILWALHLCTFLQNLGCMRVKPLYLEKVALGSNELNIVEFEQAIRLPVVPTRMYF